MLCDTNDYRGYRFEIYKHGFGLLLYVYSSGSTVQFDELRSSTHWRRPIIREARKTVDRHLTPDLVYHRARISLRSLLISAVTFVSAAICPGVVWPSDPGRPGSGHGHR